MVQAGAYRALEQEIAGLIPSMVLFLPWIDDSHYNRIHSSLTVFDNGILEKQPVACKEYCLQY